jgi:hypothetical protein
VKTTKQNQRPTMGKHRARNQKRANAMRHQQQEQRQKQQQQQQEQQAQNGEHEESEESSALADEDVAFFESNAGYSGENENPW